MEIFAKGQLSYMILNCLLERDFYGLDFISEINKKSNGRIMLKKPSVYSNLTRMEKQKYVSSYTQSSELGPNRRYYSITEKGKEYYQQLKAHFDANNIDVFRDFQTDDGYSVETPTFNFEEQHFVSQPAFASANNISENNFEHKSTVQSVSKTLYGQHEYQNENDDDQFVEQIENEDDQFVEQIENDSDDGEFFDFSSLDSPQTSNSNLYEQTQQNASTTESIETVEQTDTIHTTQTYIEERKQSLIDELETTDQTSNEPALQEPEQSQSAESVESVNMTNDTIDNITNNSNLENENAKNQEAIQNENKIESIENKSQISSQTANDDGAFLSREQVDSYNKHIYDISKDIRKYKKQRSFAEDQIAMTVETPLQESEEKNRSNLEAFKNSLIENRNKFAEQNEFERFNARQNRVYGASDSPTYTTTQQEKTVNANSTSQSMQSIPTAQSINTTKGNTYFQEKPVEQVVTDDGKFITHRITEEVRPRKIQPPRLKIVQQEREETLPPPKRDVKIDPSHKEIISQLYSKTKTVQDEELRDDMLYDYQDLSQFYKEQNIEFNEYKRNNVDVKHNTNKLAFYQSLIVFFLLAIASASIFLIFHYTSNLNATFNFLYILLPALQLIVVAVKFYNYKYHTSWIPKQMMSFWALLGYTALVIGVVIGLNFIFGLNTTNFALYATTLILPIVLIIIALPASYLIQRSLIVRHWK